MLLCSTLKTKSEIVIKLESWFWEEKKPNCHTFSPHTKHLSFFQKQKFMGLLYPAQEEYIYINVVSTFLATSNSRVIAQFLCQLLFEICEK